VKHKQNWQQALYWTGLTLSVLLAAAPSVGAQTAIQPKTVPVSTNVKQKIASVVTTKIQQKAAPVTPVPLPVDVAGQHDFAIQLARDGKYDQALPLLKHAAAVQPHPKYVSDYLVVLRWAGRDDQALAVYHDWTASHSEPLTSYALKVMGDIYFGAGERDKAYSFYHQAAAMGDTTAQLAIAQRDAVLGDYGKAMPFYDKQIAQNPDNYKVYVDRANAYISGGAYMSADADYKKALSLIPAHDAKARLFVDQNRATGFIRAGENAEARDVLYPYIQAGTATTNMQCDYILALQGTANYERAADEGEKIWPDKSKVPAYGLRALADSYIRLKKYDKAIAYHTQALQQSSTEAKFHSYLSRGYAYVMTNHLKEGLADYAAAIKERPASRFLVCEDAKHFFAAGRFHLGKELFRMLCGFDTMVQTKEQAAGGSDHSVYRQQFAYDLLIYDMPRESYTEYKKLAAQTAFKETAYAGMAQAAIRYGDYKAARSALQKLSAYDTGSKEAEQARKAWNDRWRGRLTANAALFKNYQDKDYRDGSIQMENDLGDSWHLLTSWGYSRRNQYGSSASHSGFNAGVRHIGHDLDARVWLLGDVPSGLGYEYDLDYYFRDFTWLNYSERRSGVDNPDGYNRGIKHTERSLTLHRQIGPKDNFEVGYLWDRYSDHNRGRGFNWRYRHMSYKNIAKEVEWYLFQNHYGWNFESPYYDSPGSRVAYGPGLRLWWEKPRIGYWELITELSFGADSPDNTDFTPFARLEKGWYLAPGRLIAVGFEYGWRSDRTNDTNRLGKGYHQIDFRYEWDW